MNCTDVVFQLSDCRLCLINVSGSCAIIRFLASTVLLQVYEVDVDSLWTLAACWFWVLLVEIVSSL